MAITVRKDPEPIKLPGLTMRAYEIDFDSSYASGGEPFDFSADFDVIKGAVFENKAGFEFEITSKDAPASATIKAYTQSAVDLQAKIKAFKKAGAAAGVHAVTGLAVGDKLLMAAQFDAIKDATSNTQQYKDTTLITGEFSVTGTSVANNTGGTAGSANDGLLFIFAKPIAASALSEVAATTNLSAVTKVGLLVWGKKSA